MMVTTAATVRTVQLVRLREGVFATGERVRSGDRRPRRLVHLVDVAADLESSDGVRACCGVEFAPGTLMAVPWIEDLPHKRCLRQSPWAGWRIEADYLAGRVVPAVQRLSAGVEAEVLAILDAIPAVAGSIEAANRIVGQRDGWVQVPDGVLAWEYAGSLQGALIGEKRYPRNHDLGLAPLTVELVTPGVLRIRWCGVVGGCSEHLVRVEDVALDDVSLVERRLVRAEVHARAVGLGRLSWCLILGPCAARPVTDYASERERGA